MELSTPHTDQPLLLGLAVFQNLYKLEYVRSIHLYKKGGYIHTIQEEFVSKKGGDLTKMSAPTHLACLSGGPQYVKAYMDILRAKQENESWKCLLDFCTSPPPRNPHLQTTPDMLVASCLTNLNALFTNVSNAHENHAIKWDHPQCILPSLSQGHVQVDQHTALVSPDTMSQRLQLDLWQQWGTDLELASPRISQAFELPLLRSNTCDASMALYGATSSPMPNNNNVDSPWTHAPLVQTSHMLLNVMAEPQSNDEMGTNLTGFAWTLTSPNSQFESFLGESSSNCNVLASVLPLDSNQMALMQLGHGVNERDNKMRGYCNQMPFDCGILQPMSSTSNTYSSCDERSLEAENSETPDQFKEPDCRASNGFQKAKDSSKYHKSSSSRAATGRLTELTKDELTHYFNMPITQASKELKVGLTVLKKRCRIFGIPRWPHRKMKSINSLIHNIQDLAKGDGDNDNDPTHVQVAVEELEKQKKAMQESPAIQLAERTKRLRQACFKASYRKRRQAQNDHSIVDNHHTTTINSSNSNSSNNSSSNSSFYLYCQ